MYQKKRPKEPDERMEKLDLLSDPKARRILVGCKETSRSVDELSRKEGIPLNICHRIVSILEKFDLIREETVVWRGGKEVSLYRTVNENVSVKLGEREPKIELEFFDNSARLSVA